jgi:hypothetical protein
MTVKSEVYFAQIPEWILDADISAQAVRLYCVLNRHANKNHIAFPGRKSLSSRVRCSKATIDRAMKELQAIGAVEVTHRREPGSKELDTNAYLLRVLRIGMRTGDDTPSRADDDTGSRVGDEVNRAIETEPLETEKTFAPFWGDYPSNAQGRKPEKQLALKQWQKLSPQDRELALVGVKHYADDHKDGAYVKYAHRWLRDRTFEDWQTPARASPNGKKDKFRGINNDWERVE